MREPMMVVVVLHGDRDYEVWVSRMRPGTAPGREPEPEIALVERPTTVYAAWLIVKEVLQQWLSMTPTSSRPKARSEGKRTSTPSTFERE